MNRRTELLLHRFSFWERPVDLALFVTLAATLLFHLSWSLSGWRPAHILPWFSDAPISASFLLSSVLGFRAAVRARRTGTPAEARAWFSLALGQLLWGVGEAYYTRLDLAGVTALFPGPSDVLFLLLPVTFIVGMAQMPRAELKRFVAVSFSLDVLIVLCTLGALFWSQFMVANLQTYHDNPLRLIVSQAYPLSDLLLFALLLVVLLWRPAGVVGLTLLPFAVGLALFFSADTWYALMMSKNTYVSGAPGDTLWTAAAVMFGVAAVMVQRPLGRRRRRVIGWLDRTQKFLGVLPYIAVAVTYTLLTTVTDHGGPRTLGVLVLAVTVTVFVLARQFLALRENSRLSQKLLYDATHDALTGLLTRAALIAETDAVIARAVLEGRLCALLFLDLDRFKAVNDTLGHAAGDALLIDVGERLRHVVREGNIVARLGGDEFVLLLTSLSSPEQAELVATRAVSALSQPFPQIGRDVTVSVSVGVTLLPADALSADEALRNADLAMYAAKTGGRDGYAMFDAVLVGRHRDRKTLEQDLPGAGSRGELSLVYQPQFSVRGELRGLEALLRWQHPVYGAVPPSTFIPLAEEGGCIHLLGAWVLGEALRQAGEWGETLSGVTLSVNASALEFARPDFIREVRGAISRSGVPAQVLTIELTESCVIGDAEVAQLRLRELRAMGVRVSLDDFGTGYSSLSSLRVLSADEVKLDRSFLRDLSSGSQGEAVFRAVVALGHGLGLSVLAEGIETPEHLSAVIACGVDDVQGFHLGRPQNGGVTTDMLRERPVRRAGHELKRGRSPERPGSVLVERRSEVRPEETQQLAGLARPDGS